MFKFLKQFFYSLLTILLYFLLFYVQNAFALSNYLVNSLYLVSGIMLAVFIIHLIKMKKTHCISICILDTALLLFLLFAVIFTSLLSDFPAIASFIQANQARIFQMTGILIFILFIRIYKNKI